MIAWEFTLRRREGDTTREEYYRRFSREAALLRPLPEKAARAKNSGRPGGEKPAGGAALSDSVAASPETVLPPPSEAPTAAGVPQAGPGDIPSRLGRCRILGRLPEQP